MLAHLVERFHGMEEVRSSSLLHSTTHIKTVIAVFFVLRLPSKRIIGARNAVIVTFIFVWNMVEWKYENDFNGD